MLNTSKVIKSYPFVNAYPDMEILIYVADDKCYLMGSGFIDSKSPSNQFIIICFVSD